MNEEARYPLSLEQAATLAWLYNVGHFASDCLQALKAHLRLALQTVDGASPEELLAAVKSRYWIPGRPLKADSRVQNCFRSSAACVPCGTEPARIRRVRPRRTAGPAGNSDSNDDNSAGGARMPHGSSQAKSMPARPGSRAASTHNIDSNNDNPSGQDQGLMI